MLMIFFVIDKFYEDPSALGVQNTSLTFDVCLLLEKGFQQKLSISLLGVRVSSVSRKMNFKVNQDIYFQ